MGYNYQDFGPDEPTHSKGCELDTDGDGNCPKHPNGCKVSWSNAFKGKCVSCAFSRPSPITDCRVAKHQLICGNAKAITRGLGARGWGGGVAEAQVHKLFGCVYWESI